MKNDRYFGVRINRDGKARTLYFHASRIQVQAGDLLLLRESEGQERLFRALAAGTWKDVFEADGFNGDELFEEHDYDEATGKDERNPSSSND